MLRLLNKRTRSNRWHRILIDSWVVIKQGDWWIINRFGLVKMAYEALNSGIHSSEVNGNAVVSQSWYESLGGKSRTDFMGPIDLLSVHCTIRHSMVRWLDWILIWPCHLLWWIKLLHARNVFDRHYVRQASLGWRIVLTCPHQLDIKVF